jgi:hypothetical protein
MWDDRGVTSTQAAQHCSHCGTVNARLMSGGVWSVCGIICVQDLPLPVLVGTIPVGLAWASIVA